MTFTLRNKKEAEARIQDNSVTEISKYLENNPISETTRTVEKSIGNVKTSTGELPIFRTDHYVGAGSKPEGGRFLYSRYTVNIGGIKISFKEMNTLRKALGVLK